MSTLFIKGTVMGVRKEDWLNNPEYLSSTLLMMLQNWHQEYNNPDGTYRKELPDFVKRQYGEVNQALIALENDLHNLSIVYHQMLHIKDTNIEAGLKELYLSNLTESYFTNIRSIYDHISCFPRILLDESSLENKAAKTTSFNELLGFCDKNNKEKRLKAEKIYSQNSINTVGECKKDFDIVKRVRDAIIHHGKEPVVLLNTENYLSFKIPMHVGNYSSNNLLPDILGIGDTAYPLLDYIRKVTVDLLLNMERIGNCIGNEYISKQPTQTLYFYGLIGICIKDFVNFLFPEGKLKFFMP